MENYHKLGYIKVNEYDFDPDIDGVISTVYIKANKISVIDCLGEEEEPTFGVTRIYLMGDESFCYEVKESAKEIFDQLDNIHPDLR